jgi:hypothetical protein
MGSPGAAQTAPTEQDIASSCILDLDDASVCAVFSWLNAQELVTVALCCQRFSTVSRGNPLWLQLLSRDFGLALTSTTSAGAAAAVGLYKQLLEGSKTQHALPCRAVCTDGGCDAAADSTYWVSSLNSNPCTVHASAVPIRDCACMHACVLAPLRTDTYTATR